MSIWNTQVRFLWYLFSQGRRWGDIIGWFKFVQPLMGNRELTLRAIAWATNLLTLWIGGHADDCRTNTMLRNTLNVGKTHCLETRWLLQKHDAWIQAEDNMWKHAGCHSSTLFVNRLILDTQIKGMIHINIGGGNIFTFVHKHVFKGWWFLVHLCKKHIWESVRI